MSDAKELFEQLEQEAVAEYGIRIRTKRDNLWLWKAIHYILLVLSFGQMKTFLTEFVTTLGRDIYWPLGWSRQHISKEDYITLRHELKHVHRFRQLGLGCYTLGIIVFGLLYLFVPLPVLFAWFRYYFEREAYLESYRAAKEVGLQPNIMMFVDLLSGPKYLWTWVIRSQVKKWFLKNL